MALGALPFDVHAAGDAGTWSGVLEVGALRLRLKLTIAEDDQATLLSPDQSATPHTGQVTRRASGEVELKFPAIRASYVGRLASSDRIDGIFKQGGGSFPLVFERGEAALRPLPAIRPLDQAQLGDLRRQVGAPAMTAACTRKGQAIKLWVDGERQIGSGIAAQKDDIWHLGSITKSMTSTLVGRLVEEGAVRWEDTVGDLIGTTAPDMNDAYRRATFRHLLSHRAGLPANIETAAILKFPRESTDAREDRKAYARLALAQAPIGPMETNFEYSNSGYVVAGTMLESKLGTPWENLIRTKLFEPLALASAGFGAPGHAGALDQPVGHAKTGPGGALQPFPVGSPITDNPAALGPAGRVHMNLTDLLRYLAAHRDDTDFLKPDTWRRLHTPPFGGAYAMGWTLRAGGELSHAGSNTLWYAEVLVDKAAGVVAAAATNDGDIASVSPIIGKVLLEAGAAA